MPRNLPVAFSTHLKGDAITLALCALLTRSDGLTLAMTSHDVDLVIGGVTYHAASGVDASAVRFTVGTGADNLEMSGVTQGGLLLASESLTETDILAGRWDSAGIVLSLYNWASVADGGLTLLSGTLGDITLTDGAYRAEVLSLAYRLGQMIGDVTASTCRVRDFGDARCNPPAGLASYQQTGTISAVTNRRLFTVAVPAAPAADYYTYGKVEILSGANVGLVREVKTGAGLTITLQETLPYNLVVGDSVRVTAGCNRAFSTCKTKFGNVTNFRGEPHVPGTDILIERGRTQ